jgi:hypothetical protein
MQLRTHPRPRRGDVSVRRFVTVLPRAALAASFLLAPASAQTPYLRTFLGGSGYERVQGVAVGPLGRVYVAGHTDSASLATLLPQPVGGFDKTWNGDLDGFVAILSPDLREVLHWTMIGGSGEDRAYQVEVDPAGNVVVVGFSSSSNLPVTTGAPNHGEWDAFVARFSPDLTSLLACTAVGGSGEENPRGSIDLDSAGNVFLGGSTTSFDFPTTPGVFQGTHAPANPDPRDAFVAKLDPAGNVVWATLLGGGANDAAYSGCRVASDGSVFVAGMTNSPDLPTTAGAYQTSFGGHVPYSGPYSGDGFVARFSADGAQLLFCTFLGGIGPDSVAGNDALELDSADNPVVIGGTSSANFPVTAGVFDAVFGGVITGKPDAFVAKLSADGSQLLASTFLGGEQAEEPSGLAVAPGGEVLLAGNTTSANFPVTPDAAQPNASGGVCDAFFAELSDDLRFLSYSTYLGGHGTMSHGDRGRGLDLLPSGDVALVGDTNSNDLPVSGNVYDSTYNGGPGDGFVDIEFVTRSYSFGQGKVTSIGTTPVLQLVGLASASSGSATFDVSGGLPNAAGSFGWSNGPVASPYLGGTWYLHVPVHRMPGIVHLGASGETIWTTAVVPAMVGETRIFQFWFRDAAHPDGTRAGLTNAVKVAFVP